ncbi:UDP-glucose 4-epimerase GalE [bacterium]|nr:UDP-glucose 4-epimerase GalE [bacterium]
MLQINKKPTVLITGGAGYIGSHTALFLHLQGYNILAIDTFCHNQKLPTPFVVKKFKAGKRYFKNSLEPDNSIIVLNHDFSDQKILADIFKNNNIHAVLHFAALIEVGESVRNPKSFYNNNVIKTLQLLETMTEHNIKKIIFSSSCAVYGNPQYLPLVENHPKNPINPYGNNKLIIEMALNDFQQAYGLEFVALRYFNAAGAMPDYNLGEQHHPETHLIPLILHAAYEKKRFYIFGDDYETKDGSCIRDYLHVWDLANAHHKALEHLNNNNPSDCFNLGTGQGISVIQMVKEVEKACNCSIKKILSPKRAGDPAILVADPSKAFSILDWKPEYSDLKTIIQTAKKYFLARK